MDVPRRDVVRFIDSAPLRPELGDAYAQLRSKDPHKLGNCAIISSPAMHRRHFLRLIIAGTAVAGGVAVAAALSYRVRWTLPPSITVISREGDSRVPLVREAVDYWNQGFAELGTPFRLGEVTAVVGAIPDADVLALGPSWRPTLPAGLERYPGDVLVVLSDASFISCTAPRGRQPAHVRTPRALPAQHLSVRGRALLPTFP